MSYSVSTQTSLSGNFKRKHLPDWENLIKDDSHGLKDYGFKSKERIGLNFSQMVYVTQPNGVTFASTDAAAELNAPIAAQSRELTFDSYQIALRERISYTAADRMASNEQSYLSLMGDLPMLLRLSHVDFAETLFWWGDHADGIGKIATGGITGNVLTIDDDHWAPRIWVGRENLWLDVYRGTSYVKSVQVASYNLDNQTLTVDNASGLAADDLLFFKGAYGVVKPGVFAIAEETTDQFGQNPTTYNLLKATERDLGGASKMRFMDLTMGCAQSRAKGLSGKVKAYMSEFTWPDIVDEVDAARTDPQRGGQATRGAQIERGADSMKLITPTGTVEAQVTSFMKKGKAIGICQDNMLGRYGSKDIHYVSEQPQGGGDSVYFLHAPNHLAYEMRTHSDNTAYTPRAGSLVLWKGIKNSVDGGT